MYSVVITFLRSTFPNPSTDDCAYFYACLKRPSAELKEDRRRLPLPPTTWPNCHHRRWRWKLHVAGPADDFCNCWPTSAAITTICSDSRCRQPGCCRFIAGPIGPSWHRHRHRHRNQLAAASPLLSRSSGLLPVWGVPYWIIMLFSCGCRCGCGFSIDVIDGGLQTLWKRSSPGGSPPTRSMRLLLVAYEDIVGVYY